MEIAVAGEYSASQKAQRTKLVKQAQTIRDTIKAPLAKRKDWLEKAKPLREKYRALRIAGTAVPASLIDRLRPMLDKIAELNEKTRPAREKIKAINIKLKALKRAAGFVIKKRKKVIRRKFKPMDKG